MVEHSIGNGEVDSSILSGSTIHFINNTALSLVLLALLLQVDDGTTAQSRQPYFAKLGPQICKCLVRLTARVIRSE